MPNNILDGLSLVDSIGRSILATTLATLVLAIVANMLVRARYRALERDIEESRASGGRFTHPLLNDVVRSAEDAARRSSEPNTQAIIEEHFQSQLGPLLLAERFVRAATGLVIILGLLGTFYGLTSSIGKLVHLVSGDGGGAVDVTLGVTSGLTQALSGMAVAFSNSLVGIVSAVVLTVVGVFSSPTDHRVALMLKLETHLERVVAEGGPALATPSGFAQSVERLEGTVARFEAALHAFSTSTREFSEFNAHLKDNVQRMSLGFADLSDALREQVVTLKHRNGG